MSGFFSKKVMNSHKTNGYYKITIIYGRKIFIKEKYIFRNMKKKNLKNNLTL